MLNMQIHNVFVFILIILTCLDQLLVLGRPVFQSSSILVLCHVLYYYINHYGLELAARLDLVRRFGFNIC